MQNPHQFTIHRTWYWCDKCWCDPRNIVGKLVIVYYVYPLKEHPVLLEWERRLCAYFLFNLNKLFFPYLISANVSYKPINLCWKIRWNLYNKGMKNMVLIVWSGTSCIGAKIDGSFYSPLIILMRLIIYKV